MFVQETNVQMHIPFLYAEREADNFVIQSWQTDKQPQFKNTYDE